MIIKKHSKNENVNIIETNTPVKYAAEQVQTVRCGKVVTKWLTFCGLQGIKVYWWTGSVSYVKNNWCKINRWTADLFAFSQQTFTSCHFLPHWTFKMKNDIKESVSQNVIKIWHTHAHTQNQCVQFIRNVKRLVKWCSLSSITRSDKTQPQRHIKWFARPTWRTQTDAATWVAEHHYEHD